MNACANDKQRGGLYCTTPEKLLFDDLADAAKEKWVKMLQPAEGWDGTVTYCGWVEGGAERVHGVWKRSDDPAARTRADR